MQARHLRKAASTVMALVGLVAGSAAWAGGFYTDVDAPTAKSGPMKDALVVVHSGGCVKPNAITVSATAEGLVDGKRKSLPLRVVRLKPGTFAVKGSVPTEGTWILALNSKAHPFDDTVLVETDGNGKVAWVNRTVDAEPGSKKEGTRLKRDLVAHTYRGAMKKGEVDALLQKLASKERKKGISVSAR
jgi:hypothetical protein